ncbi:hypothetical protein pSal_SNUABM02_207 [Salmonella phage pSal-SNUABM-02]|nr:hypothetical protein pSal_SNUABM02_207 [Salmonella phage pSal-SNUABM-02]
MTTELLRNPGHCFGYVQLPEIIDVNYTDDKEEVCWAPATLIEREIFKSVVDVMFRIGRNGPLVYLGKVTELKTSHNERFLRIDTTGCSQKDFDILREYVLINRPVCQHRPYLTSVHIDNFITDVHLRAETLHEEETGRAVDTVLNMVVITLAE